MLYGSRYSTSEIIRDGKGSAPAAANALTSQLGKYSYKEVHKH
jgi:hypothetical protein